MAGRPEEFEGADADAEPVARRTPTELVRQSLITGTAIILPLAVTLLILGFVLNFISSRLGFVTKAIRGLPFVADTTQTALIQAVTMLILVAVIFVLGFLAEFSARGDGLSETFDDLMASVPGIGGVYSSFNEMSEIILDSDTDSFQEVKLVEYPTEDSYVVAFKTTETPGVIETDTGHEDMVTLFMPMAPNPVMGGFVIHVSKDRVTDVDMSVEQGIRSIVTSGVAIGEDDPEFRGLTPGEMKQIGEVEQVGQQLSRGERTAAPHDPDDRLDEYDRNVSPEHADTAQKIADRQRDDPAPDVSETVPAEVGRDADDRGATETTPAEASGREERVRESTAGTPAEEAGRDDDDE
ncbi:DUF502 domain-containing protein [Halorarius halobius]|uniref:DUF502 domain-containing protein n=1 Tax=Halorarius halobius TaxID=2962671 RepID=UPI0020CF7463|nr:DUF502 domain-containing protein [Halorarius halobius]